MNLSLNAYDLFHYLKKEGSNYDEVTNAVQLRNENLPAYEELIHEYLSMEKSSAIVVRKNEFQKVYYSLVGYDDDQRRVFLKEKDESTKESQNEKIMSLEIEEFIFGPYQIWDIVDPMERYTQRHCEELSEDLPF